MSDIPAGKPGQYAPDCGNWFCPLALFRKSDHVAWSCDSCQISGQQFDDLDQNNTREPSIERETVQDGLTTTERHDLHAAIRTLFSILKQVASSENLPQLIADALPASVYLVAWNEGYDEGRMDEAKEYSIFDNDDGEYDDNFDDDDEFDDVDNDYNAYEDATTAERMRQIEEEQKHENDELVIGVDPGSREGDKTVFLDAATNTPVDEQDIPF